MPFNRADYQLDNGDMQAFAWPGGYPLYYLAADCEPLCAKCAGCPECRAADVDTFDKQWNIVAADIHWEGPPMFCAHCNATIESAYGEVADSE